MSTADAGMPVLCLACGRSFAAPAEIAAAPAGTPLGLAGEVAHRGGRGKSVDTGANTGGVDGDAEAAAALLSIAAADAPAPTTAGDAANAPAHGAGTASDRPAPPPVKSTKAPDRNAPTEAERSWRPLTWLGWAAAALLALAWLAESVSRSPTRNRRGVVAVATTKATDASSNLKRETADPQPTPVPEFDHRADPTLVTEPPDETGDEDASAPAIAPGSDSISGEPDHPPDPATAPSGAGGTEGSSERVPPGEAEPDASAPSVRDEEAGGSQPPDPDDSAAPPAHAAPATAPTERRAVWRRRGKLRPLPPPSGEVSDEQIETAIRRAINFLIAQLQDNQAIAAANGRSGVQFLATYALLQAGLTVKDPRLDPRGVYVDEMIEQMKRLRIEPVISTYERSVRAAALSLLNRPQDRKALQDDVRRLVAGHTKGSYGYVLPGDQRGGRGMAVIPAGGASDNSNSQYGLLGVWSGAEAGLEIPSNYWEAVNQHWVDDQLADGTWSYRRGEFGPGPPGSGYTSMAAAGTASLFVTYDQLTRKATGLGRDPFPPALERAMRWWETNDIWLERDDPSNPFGDRYWGYQLYGIERVGLASGFKYFGKHNWYRALARQAVDAQLPDGSWSNGSIIETSYALLFLARGRPPIMMNKLRFDGFWANRPRDLANLARFATHSTERQLNWQIVDVRTEWHDWLDAPILYLASHLAPDFDESEYDKLRDFALAGGMIFTHADGGRKAFDDFATRLGAELFPRYEFFDLPQEHPIYNLVAKVDPKPPLRAISNGSRILMVHSPTELSQSWQMRDDKRRANHFNLGLNLFFYATGKRDLRNRLDSPYVPEPRQLRDPVEGPIRVARLRYAGHWDPEPAAWGRFARLFLQRSGIPLEPVTVKWADLRAGEAPLAHLTGNARYLPTPQEVAALREYVEGGGVLLVDNCGGTGAFAGELKAVLADAFPTAILDPIPPGHPVLRTGQPGMADVTKPKYRPFAAARQGSRPGLYGFSAGRGIVLLTTLDVTSGLLHTGTWGIYGFDPAYCEALVQNIAFWAYDTEPK